MTSKTGPYSIVGLVGRTGSGRETAAGILAHATDYQRISLSDAARAELARAFGVDSRIFSARNLKEQSSSALAIGRCNDPRFVQVMFDRDADLCTARTPLQIMRWWTVEYRRYMDGEYYWSHQLHNTIESLLDQGHRRLVVTDIQFPNDARLIRQLTGKLWRIKRPCADSIRAAHSSEQHIESINTDLTIQNSGTVSSLVYDVMHAHQSAANQPTKQLQEQGV